MDHKILMSTTMYWILRGFLFHFIGFLLIDSYKLQQWEMRDLKLIILTRRACNANELEDSWQTSGLTSSVQPSKKQKQQLIV